MNGLPYIYLPRPDERVKLDRHGGGTGDVQVSVCGQGAGSVRILAAEVPGVAAGIAAAMHEAAGLPAPVILERPGPTFEISRAGRFEVGRLGGRVTVGLYGIQPEEIEPAEARRLAALIAFRAGEARDDEPDPAEVEELTRILRGIAPGMAHPGEGDYKTAVVKPFAEAALQWMKDKQRRGEGDGSAVRR